MSSTLRLALLIIIAGVLAFAARFMLLSNQAEPEPEEPTVQVRIAAMDLPAGLLLRDDDVTWQSLPQSQVPKGAITEKLNLNLTQGALLRQAISADHILKTNDIITANAAGFLAAVLKPGMRAVSVQVDEVSGNAGLIQPGDYVDMILTQRISPPNSSNAPSRPQIVSETVVERARIIAVGSVLQRNDDKANPTRARTVTIEVQPRAAEAVTVATQLGSISLALRSFATTERDPTAHPGDQDGALVVAWRDLDPQAEHGPIWGSDVSRVLSRQAHDAETAADAPVPSTTAPVAATPKNKNLVIFRGGNTMVINSQRPNEQLIPAAPMPNPDLPVLSDENAATRPTP